MSGRWAGSIRRAGLPAGWEALRREVIARAAGRCEQMRPDGTRCPLPGRDVHHAVDRDDHRVESLALLCARHHALHTSAEASATRWPTPLTSRPAERHPGARR